MATIRLNGTPLAAAGEIAWTIRPGTKPHQAVIETEAQEAAAIVARATIGTAEIELPDGRLVKKLTVLGETVPSAPYLKAIVVADRRWEWPRLWLKRTYNLRRRTGDRRRPPGQAGPVQAQAVVDDVYYAAWTLKAGKPWTAREVLVDALERSIGGSRDYRIGPGVGDRQVPVEDLEIDDSIDGGLERILAYLPGAGIFVDLDGVVVVYDTISGDEAAMIAAAGPPAQGGGYFARVDVAAIRPGEIEVLFDREIEVRYDFDESVTTRDRQDETRYLDNVGPVPDASLSVSGRDVAQGTWLTFDELFSGWTSTAPTTAGVKQPPLSHSVVQELFFSPYLWIMYGGTGGFEDPVQLRRVGTVHQHYRQSFRLNRRWRDRIHSVRAYRVAIIDAETGQRAPALVMADYAVRPTLRAIFKEKDKQNLAANVRCYPTDAKVDGGTGRPSSAVLELIDGEQGIFRLDFRLDPFGEGAQIAPCALDEKKMPSADPTAAVLTFEFCPLEANHKALVVLTVLQGAPNDLRKLHRLKVRPGDVQAMIGRSIGEARGPKMQVRVNAAVLTARFAWDDGRATDVDRAFGIPNREPDDADEVDIGEPVNKDHLEAVAKAVAARVYASMAPRYEGVFTVGLNSSIEPRGSIAAVTHLVTPEGAALTRLDIPPLQVPDDLYARLPDSVRKIVMRLAQP